MEIELKSLNIFYNPTLGQIVATYGDTGISVYEKTEDPFKRGLDLMKIALEQTGNISLCSRVDPDDLFNQDGSAIAAPTDNALPDPTLPLKKGPKS